MHTRSFKQIPFNVGTADLCSHVEFNADKFALVEALAAKIFKTEIANAYKSGRVIVSNGLCIAECFKDWICLQNLLLQPVGRLIA